MSGKTHFRTQLNWVTSSPVPYNYTTPLSGVVLGPMAGTNTIYTDILDVTLYDDIGLELTWSGTPTGTIQIMGSSSGQDFYALTFNPILGQPAGSAGGYLIDLTQFPWSYLMVQYTNSSGTGSLSTWLTAKDI